MALSLADAGIGTLNPRVSSALNRDRRLDDLRIGHLVAPHAIAPGETFDHLTGETQGDLVLDQIWAADGLIKQVEFPEGAFATKRLIGRGLKVGLAKRVVDEWNRKLEQWTGSGAPYVPKQIERLRRNILDFEERLIATRFFTAGSYASANKTTGIGFAGTGFPAGFQAAAAAIKANGRSPSLFALGETSIAKLRANATIQAYFKGPGGDNLVLTNQRLEEYLTLLAEAPIRIAVGSARRNINGTPTLLWTHDQAILTASDYNDAPQTFAMDDQTFAATAVLPLESEEGVDPDASEFFSVLTGELGGAEKITEYAIAKIYEPIALNWGLGYHFTNTGQ
jgi:hypothetical protein